MKSIKLIFMLLITVLLIFPAACRKNEDTGLTSSDVKAMKNAYEDLTSDLENEITEKNIELRQYHDALTINIADKLFFESGKAELKPEAGHILDRIARILKEKLPGKIIRIEGHTDKIPIGKKLKKKYPNNWMLGAARAANVAEYFREISGINPKRMSIVSYSSYRPLTSNKTSAQRAKNRRIEIIVMNPLKYQVEELKSAETNE
jgi:chemotaxis protein MotB